MTRKKRLEAFAVDVLVRLNDLIGDMENRSLAYVLSGGRMSAFANPDWELDRFWTARNRRARRALYALKKQKLIEVQQRGRRVQIALTEAGEQRLLERRIAQAKKYTTNDVVIVVFDIPEEERKTRLLIRRFLSEHHFTQVQKSVWESPYDVGEAMTAFLATMDVGDWIHVYQARRLTLRNGMIVAKKYVCKKKRKIFKKDETRAERVLEVLDLARVSVLFTHEPERSALLRSALATTIS